MSVANRLADQRKLAEQYGFVVTPKDDILQFRLTSNDYVFHVWYTTYDRGNRPWAVARVTPIPKGEKGEGQEQYSDHQYFAELEDAFIYASGETLKIMDIEEDGTQIVNKGVWGKSRSSTAGDWLD